MEKQKLQSRTRNREMRLFLKIKMFCKYCATLTHLFMKDLTYYTSKLNRRVFVALVCSRLLFTIHNDVPINVNKILSSGRPILTDGFSLMFL